MVITRAPGHPQGSEFDIKIVLPILRMLRYTQSDPILIVLSYAPSAAAVWQYDRVRAMSESNSVRHKVFFKVLGLAPLGVLWEPHHNIRISEYHNIIIE